MTQTRLKTLCGTKVHAFSTPYPWTVTYCGLVPQASDMWLDREVTCKRCLAAIAKAGGGES